MWCVVLKNIGFGYEVLEERFPSYDDAFAFGEQKGKETGREFGVDIAPSSRREQYWDGDVE